MHCQFKQRCLIEHCSRRAHSGPHTSRNGTGAAAAGRQPGGRGKCEMSGAAGAAGTLSAMQQYEHFRQQFASPLAAPQPSPQVPRCSAWVCRHAHKDTACRRPVCARMRACAGALRIAALRRRVRRCGVWRLSPCTENVPCRRMADLALSRCCASPRPPRPYLCCGPARCVLGGCGGLRIVPANRPDARRARRRRRQRGNFPHGGRQRV